MKVFRRRWLGASVLALAFSFGSVGCSGDQETEEPVNGAENQAADENAGGENTASEDGTEGGGGNTAVDDGAAAADAGATDPAAGATADAAGTGAGENDLQDIITEMNGQQPAGENTAADSGAAAAPAEASASAEAGTAAAPAMASAPAAASGNAAAPAPAAPAGRAEGSTASALPQQQGGTPASAGLPEIGSKMAYIVEKGDTLGKISQKIFGSPKHWQEMATLSGLTNPKRIYPGDVVYYTLDDSAVAFAKAYDAVQRAEEQVKPGDTLASISKRVYGESSGWRSIWRHNDNIENPDVVQSGSTVFYVPKGAVQAAMLKVKVENVKIAKLNHPTAKKLVVKSHVKTYGGARAASVGKNLVTKTNFVGKISAQRV